MRPRNTLLFTLWALACGADRGAMEGGPLLDPDWPSDDGTADGADGGDAGDESGDGGATTGHEPGTDGDGPDATGEEGDSGDDGATEGDDGGGGDDGGVQDGFVPGNLQLGLATNPEAPSIVGGTATEREVLDIINGIRADNGIPALEWSDEIADTARSHVYDMSQLGYFSHGSSTDQGGHLYNNRVQWLYPGTYVYGLENLYWGGGSPQQAVDVWMGSSGHRPTILDEIPGIGSTRWGGVGVVDGIYGFMTAK